SGGATVPESYAAGLTLKRPASSGGRAIRAATEGVWRPVLARGRVYYPYDHRTAAAGTGCGPAAPATNRMAVGPVRDLSGIHRSTELKEGDSRASGFSVFGVDYRSQITRKLR